MAATLGVSVCPIGLCFVTANEELLLTKYANILWYELKWLGLRV
jgi:hypothetical protein